MNLPLVTDIAARQIVDSTRAFKEYVRVRNELRELGGSVRWKRVEGYEYLVQRQGHKLVYLGKRSPETEAQHAEHARKKQRLEARFKVLDETVTTSQRMNKAVRAGVVPTELIEVLLKLDELGLAERSVLFGTPALYAYGQSSGVRMDAIKTEEKKRSLVEGGGESLHLLIEEPDAFATSVLHRLTDAMKGVARVEGATLQRGEGAVLDLVFHLSTRVSARVSARASTHVSTRATAGKRSSKTSLAPTVDSGGLMPSWLDVVKAAPKYEQVVIGKTGRMALMRTVDPQLFTAMAEWASAPGQTPSETAEDLAVSQAKLVEMMLANHMVNSKIDPAQRELLVKQLSPIAPACSPSDRTPPPRR